MEAIAKTRHLKGSPRKARLVIDLIRGRNVSQALNILKFTDKRAADPIAKTLRSAIANATYLAEQQNIAIDPDDLFVKTCFVDMGVHKNRSRMRPAPQGRAFREQRHYCHITILISSDAPPIDTRSAKKSKQTSAEKGDGGAKMKAAKKSETSQKVAASDEVRETKTVAVGDLATNETVEAKTAVVETSKIEEPNAKSNNPAVSDAGEPQENRDLEAAIIDAKAEAEASDAKNVVSQTPAERNETKKADEAQQKENEILELQ